MSPSWLFWWIYQLSFGEILCLLLACTLIYLLLHRQMESRRKHQRFAASALMVWAVAAVYVTLLNRNDGAAGDFQMIPFHSYQELQDTGNLEILRSNFMNMLLFYPAGLLLASILPKRWRNPIAVTVLCMFSLSIELNQYFWQLGNAEFDDTLHNTLGAAAGAFAFHTFSKSIELEK